MDAKQFERYIARDRVMLDVGYLDDTAIPQHRLGRGMGGSKLRNVPSNIITFSSGNNGRLEMDYKYRQHARGFGWSLRVGDGDPADIPVWHPLKGWIILDDDFGYKTAPQSAVNDWIQHATVF